MKSNPAAAALCFLSLALPGMADTFTLKDGSTLEGTIISEAGDSYVLDVQVTKSIRDERKVPKADVVKIGRVRPDLTAFEPIAKMLPAPDLWTADDYARQIGVVEKFVKAYPASLKLKDAKAILETLKSESAQVAAGGLKLNGQMIAPAEYEANAYELDSRVQEARIRRLLAGNQVVPALRAFAGFDRECRGTLAYGELITPMKQVIQSHLTETRQSLASYPARFKERSAGLQRMAPDERKVTADAIKEEDAAFDARYKAEKDAELKWVTPSPFHKASLEETISFGQNELTRLGAVKTVLGADGGKAYREAWSAIHKGGNAASIKSALAAAKAAGVPPRYLAPLEAAAKGIK